jgi:hypothetical protein
MPTVPHGRNNGDLQGSRDGWSAWYWQCCAARRCGARDRQRTARAVSGYCLVRQALARHHAAPCRREASGAKGADWSCARLPWLRFARSAAAMRACGPSPRSSRRLSLAGAVTASGDPCPMEGTASGMEPANRIRREAACTSRNRFVVLEPRTHGRRRRVGHRADGRGGPALAQMWPATRTRNAGRCRTWSRLPAMSIWDPGCRRRAAGRPASTATVERQPVWKLPGPLFYAAWRRAFGDRDMPCRGHPSSAARSSGAGGDGLDHRMPDCGRLHGDGERFPLAGLPHGTLDGSRSVAVWCGSGAPWSVGVVGRCPAGPSSFRVAALRPCGTGLRPPPVLLSQRQQQRQHRPPRWQPGRRCAPFTAQARAWHRSSEAAAMPHKPGRIAQRAAQRSGTMKARAAPAMRWHAAARECLTGQRQPRKA